MIYRTHAQLSGRVARVRQRGRWKNGCPPHLRRADVAKDKWGRFCVPDDPNPPPVRDPFGRFTKRALPPPERDFSGRFCKKWVPF